ncbi:ABC transporter substrate-binding protein [Corynebacterium pygosceleis]|uniref:ABC transporter substrate-binding protein n=1 Tax=Corynebacterium pygosceleis TaxID=2800406 RepID=A0A9Q4GMB9_9CORY|nr:ABC transporter substrate-binding protein [Corynebacterium pygosceleis]MCK7638466.1 ABC transporter substrate-binding protein [Corynebacterium pygosceleis]MCK7675446.1 ABC transporter substrate-binding protein [Corynebacterium pygosceleis]MCL0121160.1 ABC transporter substrate-binding protein [Corynebacterium pygosceleis]MCX7469130.1 ABC transporter substrate-binding protein [Corynebacterium pygosceleis]
MKTRHTAAGTALFATALVLTACSGAGDGDAAGTTENAATESGTTAATSATRAAADGQITITDVEGRTVTFDSLPERIILGEGRGIFATAILDREDPLDKVVAMGSDLRAAAPAYFDNLVAAYPKAGEVPEIGNIAKGDVTVENLISHDPDALVITADHYDAAKTTGMLDKLDAAGITYIVTDFRQHPMTNTTVSVTALGELFGRKDAAESFNEEWNGVVERVKERVADVDRKPSTFLWRAAGLKDCCNTVAKANLGEMISLAGGDNLADHIIDTESGDITAEKLIDEQPEIIIATGGTWAKQNDKPQAVPHVDLGYGVSPDTSRDTLKGLLDTPGLNELNAPGEGRFYGVWHQFYDSPFNYIALEQFGKWIHPDKFSDIDPVADLRDANSRYLPFTADGTFFIGVN